MEVWGRNALSIALRRCSEGPVTMHHTTASESCTMHLMLSSTTWPSSLDTPIICLHNYDAVAVGFIWDSGWPPSRQTSSYPTLAKGSQLTFLYAHQVGPVPTCFVRVCATSSSFAASQHGVQCISMDSVNEPVLQMTST